MLGFNVTYSFGPGTADGYYAIAGCSTPNNAADRGCIEGQATWTHRAWGGPRCIDVFLSLGGSTWPSTFSIIFIHDHRWLKVWTFTGSDCWLPGLIPARPHRSLAFRLWIYLERCAEAPECPKSAHKHGILWLRLVILHQEGAWHSLRYRRPRLGLLDGLWFYLEPTMVAWQSLGGSRAMIVKACQTSFLIMKGSSFHQTCLCTCNIYIYIYIYVYIYTYIYMCVCVCVCIYTYIYVCMCIHIYIHCFTHIFWFTHIYIRTCFDHVLRGSL